MAHTSSATAVALLAIAVLAQSAASTKLADVLLTKLHDTDGSAGTPTTLVTSVNGSSTVQCGRSRQCFSRAGPITFASLTGLPPTLTQSATPWTNTETNIITIADIPFVVGARPATAISPAGSVLSITTDGLHRYFRGNGLPSTPIGNFPVQNDTDAYPYYAALPAGTDPATGQSYQPDGTADEIYVAPYNVTSQLPLKPVPTGFYPINSLIVGLTLTGAVWHVECAPGANSIWYSPSNVLPLDACWGHPYANQYHYHGYSWKCFPNQNATKDGHSPLFGYALDGFGIYGPLEGGKMITNAELDKCHGHLGLVVFDGKPTVMYHYHLNREFPYSVGCFRGNVDYYRALGSEEMRETNLPVYSRSAVAAKLRNVQAEVDAAVAGKPAAAEAVSGLDQLLTEAAAKAESSELST